MRGSVSRTKHQEAELPPTSSPTDTEGLTGALRGTGWSLQGAWKKESLAVIRRSLEGYWVLSEEDRLQYSVFPGESSVSTEIPHPRNSQ